LSTQAEIVKVPVKGRKAIVCTGYFMGNNHTGDISSELTRLLAGKDVIE
jgi:hypothetical protein